MTFSGSSGIERRTGIERTLAIGELILNRFFGGDPAVWRDRRRNKNNSIRRLAERDDCPFCRSALNEAVGVYVAVRTLPTIRTLVNVSASHVAAVLQLAPAEREQLLERAEREAWSVRELRNNVVAMRRKNGERRGRPPSPPEARVIGVLRTGVRLLEEAVQQVSSVEDLSNDARLELNSLATELSALSGRVSALAVQREAAGTRPRSELVLKNVTPSRSPRKAQARPQEEASTPKVMP